MTERTGSGRGCFKYGCFGCAALFAGVALIAISIVVLGLLLGRPPEQIERPGIAHDLPGGELALPGTDVGGRFPAIGATPDPEQVGRVELELTIGSFELVAGDPGEPPRVEGSYDAAAYELVSSIEPGEHGGWVWKVRFDRKFSWLRMMFEEEGGQNRIRVVLPRDRPFALTGNLGIGEFDVDLGGLWIVDTDLNLGTGEHRIRFEEPLAAPMNGLRLDGGVGQLTVRGVGNASPSEVSVEQSVGEVRVDLSGAWQNDADVEIRCGIGECFVGLPDEATVDLQSVELWLGETDRRALGEQPTSPDEELPVLRLRASARIGEIRFGR